VPTGNQIFAETPPAPKSETAATGDACEHARREQTKPSVVLKSEKRGKLRGRKWRGAIKAITTFATGALKFFGKAGVGFGGRCCDLMLVRSDPSPRAPTLIKMQQEQYALGQRRARPARFSAPHPPGLTPGSRCGNLETSLLRGSGRGCPRVFRAINDSDAAYVALAHQKTVLELGTTRGPTRSLRLDSSGSRRSRWDARIIAGAKSIVTNTLSSCITKTGREWRLSAGRNATSIDASLRSARHIVYCKVLLSYAAGRKLARNAEALIDTGCLDGGAILRDGRCHAEDHDGSRH
jgi:hypothetical protein